MNIVLLVVGIYLILMLGIALYFSRKESINAYFLNSRSTGLWLMTFSTVATVIGAGATIAIVSEVYNSGISFGIALPFSFVIGMIILGIIAGKIKKIGDKYNATTIVDFFANRYDKKNKTIATILQIFVLIMWTAVQAIGFATIASLAVGINYSLAIIIAAIVTILYTSMGGLKVDIITDFIQFWIILFVFVIMTIFSYSHIGSVPHLLFNLPKSHFDPFAFGGITWMVGAIVLSGFVYIGNTAHWQRIYSAKNSRVAKKSFFLSIPFMILLSIIIVFLGLVSAYLLQGINQDTAIFALMKFVLPPWIVGLGFAALLAVIMSSISSLLVGGSTVIYNAFVKENKTSKKAIIYARLITAGFGLCGFILAFLVPNIVALSLLVTYFALIFVPPVIAGIYSTKTSSDASFYSILISSILLVILYPFLKENAFVASTPIGILIILFYDKIFKRKKSKKIEK